MNGGLWGKVSVIIPAYNRGHIIANTIQSVLKQTYDDIEIIVVDDGSTDDTRAITNNIIETNVTRKRVVYVYQKNSGACAARNYGLMVSTGAFIQFLDSDDTIASDKIETQIKKMYADDTPCAIGDYAVTNEDGTITKEIMNNGDIHEYVARFRSVFISTPLIRRDSIPPGLQWNIRLARQQDMDFMFKYFLGINTWSYTPGFFSRYVMHSGEQISDSYHKGVQWSELIRSVKYFRRYNAVDDGTCMAYIKTLKKLRLIGMLTRLLKRMGLYAVVRKIVKKDHVL